MDNSRRYTTDLTDEQLDLICHEFKPAPAAIYPYRQILNGIFYVIRTGCQWRNAPKDSAWSVLHAYRRN